MKEDGGALLRIGQALHGLLSGLVSSLEEFRDVGNTLESEIAAGIGDGNPDEARPQLLLSVAGAVMEMVETLGSNIRRNAEVQELLPAVQKYSRADQRAFYDLFQDLVISRQPPEDLPSSLIDIPPLREEMLVCSSRNNLKTAKGAAGMGKRICEHSCEDHPQVVDPRLWRNLPQEIVELVFAKLPLPRIIQFCKSSNVCPVQLAPSWSAMSISNSFREAFTEGHPTLFGLLVCDLEMEYPSIRVHDIDSKEWFSFDLAGFPGGHKVNDIIHDTAAIGAYEFYLYSCDGGLACFVPLQDFTSSSILVCNPLSCMWKALPLLPFWDFKKKRIVMVQLVMDVDRKCYEVMLVGEDWDGKACSALVYNSRTGVWSILESGLVYGVDTDCGIPYLFDCSTKVLVDLRGSASLDGLEGVLAYSVAKDRLFVLNESELCGQHGTFMYVVSEFTWDSSIFDLRILSVTDTPMQVWPDPYKAILFASPSTVLVFADNGAWHEGHHQIIGRYDVTGKQWDILPRAPFGDNIHYEQLLTTFMCELRWNVSP